MKGFKLFVLLLSASLASAQNQPESWTSVDGRKLEAMGISWSEKFITLKRSSDGKILTLEHAQLAPSDVIRAVESLPFEINDNIRLRARTLEVTSKKLERETGNYAASVSLFSYDGTHVTGTATVTPITEEFKISGRSVRVDLSSLSGPGYAAVEFFAVSGEGKSQRIYHTEKKIVAFEQNGSHLIFSCAAVENFKGWVVLVRSLKSGKIIDMASSMQGLRDLVTAKVPEIAVFSTNLDSFKASVIATAQARDKPKSP
jgi:hypothetical protein